MPLLAMVPVPPPTVSELPRPTSMASSDWLLPIETLPAATFPPPLTSSVPWPLWRYSSMGRQSEGSKCRSTPSQRHQSQQSPCCLNRRQACLGYCDNGATE